MTRVAPAKVRKEAKLGLMLHKKWKRGGTAVGVARAVQLSSGKAVSDSTIKRMYSYFQRHQHDRLDKDGSDGSIPGRGYIAWLLWGGYSGRKWAEAEYKKLSGKKKNPISKPVKKIKEDLAKKDIYLIKVSLDDYRSEPWAQELVTKEEDFEVVDRLVDITANPDTGEDEPVFMTLEFVYSVLPKKYFQDFNFIRKMQNEGKIEKLKFTAACRAWLDNEQPMEWFVEQAQDRGYITKDEYLFLAKIKGIFAGYDFGKDQNPLQLIARGIDERPASAYDREELKLGLKTELEHTDDAIIASKIAKDHLDEDPHYYSKIVEMERRMKKANPVTPEAEEYLPIIQTIAKEKHDGLDAWVDESSGDILVGWMAFDEDRSKDDVMVRVKPKGQILEGHSVDDSIRNDVHDLMKKIHKNLVSYVSNKKSNPKSKKVSVSKTHILEESAKAFKKIADIIAKRFNINKNKITAKSRFKEDLGADELDVVEILEEVSQKFKKEINEEDHPLEEITKVGDVLKIIYPYKLLKSARRKKKNPSPAEEISIEEIEDLIVDTQDKIESLAYDLDFKDRRTDDFDEKKWKEKINQLKAKVEKWEKIHSLRAKNREVYLDDKLHKINIKWWELRVKNRNPSPAEEMSIEEIQELLDETASEIDELQTDIQYKNDPEICPDDFDEKVWKEKIKVLKAKYDEWANILRKKNNEKFEERYKNSKGWEREFYDLGKKGLKTNPVPAGVDPEEFDELVKQLKKRKDVDNPYALANFILKKKIQSRKNT